MKNDMRNNRTREKITKKYIVPLLCLIIAMAVLVAVIYLVLMLSSGGVAQDWSVHAKLITNGTTIRDRETKIIERECYYGYIPFLSVLQQLGYTAEWKDKDTALLIINDIELEYQDGILHEQGKDYNYLLPKQGRQGITGEVRFKHIRNELYTIADDSFISLLEEFGVRIEVTINVATRTIVINSIE